jgi:excisionase family DNA binding protein
MPDSPYLTCGEGATYLRTTKHGIYALVKTGRLKKMPGSRKLLFTREALDRCLTQRAGSRRIAREALPLRSRKSSKGELQPCREPTPIPTSPATAA